MEVLSGLNAVIAKKVRNLLRITFFMMRKGLVSKRKLIMEMNLMMKRGKIFRRSLRNMINHHHSRNVSAGGYSIQDYEFSCSSSPNPVFFHLPKRKYHYFPCINAPKVKEEHDHEELKAVVLVPKTPDYVYNLLPDEKQSPNMSPFSVRVSNYSSEDEKDGDTGKVDDEAEEFIRRFYEQLRGQRNMQLLQYQEEIQYQEMLARGT